MYEHQSKPLIPLRHFIRRLSINTLIAIFLMGVSLAVGIAGYHYFENLPWIDCYLNASMILGGMGEVDPLKTDGGKIFAGAFALYSGLLVVVSFGLILAPVMHRILHHFHAHRPPGQQ
jgi:hypothetical protein